jgi:hypothetical protein
MAWLVTVACGAAALASGCEKITEKVTQKVTESALEHTLEEQTGAKVDLNSDGKGSISVKSDKGSLQFSGAGGKIPDNWPQDVPVYPGAKVETSISNDAVQMVSVSTTDSPDQAVEFYKQKFAAFKLESTGTNQQQTLSSYRDPGGRRIQVAVGKERSGAGPNTQIALILSRVNKPSAH